MKTVILHIGTGKTGTTSAQLYLDANRDWLLARWGIDFLDLGLRRRQDFGEHFVAHDLVADWLADGNGVELQRLRQRIRNSPGDLILLSSENLYHQLRSDAIARLAEVLAEMQIRVLCYLRRQDLMAESAWKQQIKAGFFAMPIEQYLSKHMRAQPHPSAHLNYSVMLERWSERFGRDAMEVRRFERTRFRDGTVIADVFDAIGCSDAYDPRRVPAADANPSLPSELLEVIRCLNSLDPGEIGHDRSAFIESLRHQRSFADAPLLSYADRLAILKTYEDVNRAIAGEYLGDDGPCFDTSDLDRYKDDRREPVDAERLLVEIALQQWRQARRSSNAGPSAPNPSLARRLWSFWGAR